MRAAAVLLPPLLALALGAWRITVPSLWRDESFSGVAARLPLSTLRLLLADIDAVHALYYTLLRPFAAVGQTELMLRLPSLLAFTAAAYGVAVLGRRLAGPLAGLCGGVLYALLPMADRYAQEARSYALVSAVAVLATWLLLQARESASKRWYAWYAASLALLGWLHLYALLLVAAHAVAVGLSRPRRLTPWLAAVAAAGVAILPLAVVASGQREAQLFWLKPPSLAELAQLPGEIAGGPAAALLLVALAVWGAWCSRGTPVATAWAVLPVILSFLISQVYPVYDPRYVLFVVPALALLAGIGVSGLATAVGGLVGGLVSGAVSRAAGTAGRASWGHVIAPAVVVVLMAALTAPAQAAIRLPDSRPDDLRSLAVTLSADRRPGDAVLFVPRRFRMFVSVYGEPYRHLTDLTSAPGAYEPRTAAQFDEAAEGVKRIWLVSPRLSARYLGDPRLQALRRAFVVAGPTRTFGSIRLTPYTPR